jgi:nucleoside-diphosphate-sugar epimerase
MKVHILGKGPISIRLASTIAPNFDVAVYSEITPLKFEKVAIKPYQDLKVSTISNDDVVLVAWRKVPIESSVKMHVLESLSSKLGETNLLVNLSSISVYGVTDSIADESSPASPINLYGCQKLELENFFDSNFTSKILHLRVSNVFGDTFFEDVVNKLVISIKHEKTIELVEPSLHFRDYISIETLVKLIVEMINNQDVLNNVNVFNVSSGHSISILRLLQLIEEIFQRRVNYRIAPMDNSVIGKSFVSNAKIKNFLKIDLEDELVLLKEYLNRRA